jgi:casein kinase 1
VEKQRVKKGDRRSLLASEAKVLQRLQGIGGIPKLIASNLESDVSMLVMERLGPSLDVLFAANDHELPPSMVLALTYQMLDRLHVLHAMGFIHRDVKPANFALGRRNESYKVYLIDFGLAKQFYFHENKFHIPCKEYKGLTGTPQFASTNALLGMEQSRRDDIQALGYVAAYLLRGNLPWEKLTGKSTKDRNNKILEMKASTCPFELIQGYPEAFAEILLHSSQLNFEETPNYQQLRLALGRVLASCSSSSETVLDPQKYHPRDGDSPRDGLSPVGGGLATIERVVCSERTLVSL